MMDVINFDGSAVAAGGLDDRAPLSIELGPELQV
jgi:hypothetical protein